MSQQTIHSDIKIPLVDCGDKLKREDHEWGGVRRRPRRRPRSRPRRLPRRRPCP